MRVTGLFCLLCSHALSKFHSIQTPFKVHQLLNPFHYITTAPAESSEILPQFALPPPPPPPLPPPPPHTHTLPSNNKSHPLTTDDKGDCVGGILSTFEMGVRSRVGSFATNRNFKRLLSSRGCMLKLLYTFKKGTAHFCQR